MTSEEAVRAIETILTYSGLTDGAKYKVVRAIVNGDDYKEPAHGATSIFPSSFPNSFLDGLSKDDKSGIETRN